jgi:hypothetical protein
MPEMVVIDQILVSQRNPRHALEHQRANIMLDEMGRTGIGETPGETFRQADRPVSSRAPASDVIVPPPKSATTRRPKTSPKAIWPALHSVCIGSPISLADFPF